MKNLKTIDEFILEEKIDSIGALLVEQLNLSTDMEDMSEEDILNQIKEAKLDEGLIGSVVGGIAGATIGPKIGDAICKALGITQGMLYTLFHSRAFLMVVCGYLGWKY